MLRGRGLPRRRVGRFRFLRGIRPRPVRRLCLLLRRRGLLQGRGRRGLLLLLVCVLGVFGRGGSSGGCLGGASHLLVLEAEIVIEAGGAGRRGRTQRGRRERLPLARHALRGPERIVEIVLGDVQRDVHRGRDLADQEGARVVVQLALFRRGGGAAGQRRPGPPHPHPP